MKTTQLLLLASLLSCFERLRNGKPYNAQPQLPDDLAILVIARGDGYTKDIYENGRKELNWEDNPPPGLILHVASFDDSGNLRVADIWESEDQLNNFLDTSLKPYLQKFNVSVPKGEIFPIHKVLAPTGRQIV
jgi:hypothetical protein